MACSEAKCRNRFQVRIRFPEFNGKGISSSRTSTFNRSAQIVVEAEAELPGSTFIRIDYRGAAQIPRNQALFAPGCVQFQERACGGKRVSRGANM